MYTKGKTFMTGFANTVSQFHWLWLRQIRLHYLQRIDLDRHKRNVINRWLDRETMVLRYFAAISCSRLDSNDEEQGDCLSLNRWRMSSLIDAIISINDSKREILEHTDDKNQSTEWLTMFFVKTLQFQFIRFMLSFLPESTRSIRKSHRKINRFTHFQYLLAC